MSLVEISQEVAATPEQVWATLSTPATWASWFTLHNSWLEEPPVTLTAGSKLVEKVEMLGMANRLEWTVEACTQPTELRIAGTGMAGVKSQFVFTLTAAGTGTLVNVTAEFEGQLVVGALGKAVEKDARKNLAESLIQLGEAAA